MFTTLRIAWRNLGRNRKRTMLAVMAIAVAQLALLLYTSFVHGYMDMLQEVVTGPLVGHVQVHAPGWRTDRAMEKVIPNIDAVLAALRAAPGVTQAAPRLYAPVLMAQTEQAQSGVVIGIDDTLERRTGGLLADAPDLPPLGSHNVILGRAFAEKLGATVGAQIAIIGQGNDGSIANDLYTVSAILPSYVDLINSQGALMSLTDAQTLFVLPGAAHEILIRTTSGAEDEALATQLAALPALKGLEVLSWQQAAPEFVSLIDYTGAATSIAVLLVCLAAAAGIANTIMMSVYEQTREFGTLLALGCAPGRLVRQVLLEGMLMALTGVAVGTALGLGLAALSHGHPINWAAMGGKGATDTVMLGLRLPWVFMLRLEGQDILAGAVGVMITALLSAAWPAFMVSRLQPVEAMHA